jgi:hypothetical protein
MEFRSGSVQIARAGTSRRITKCRIDGAPNAALTRIPAIGGRSRWSSAAIGLSGGVTAMT